MPVKSDEMIFEEQGENQRATVILNFNVQDNYMASNDKKNKGN